MFLSGDCLAFLRAFLRRFTSSRASVPTGLNAEGSVHAAVIFCSGDKSPPKRIEVVENDLTKENVDAIVNAANSWLRHGGGVAGAIVKKGGNQIQADSDEFVAKHGPVKTGGIAVTEAGNLPCSVIIHAVGPVWEGGQKGEDKCLRDAMYNSLVECHKRQLVSLAAPAISSGIFGFPKRSCAKILFSAALQFFREEPTCSVDLVRFTNFDKETVEVFVEAASNLKNEPDVRVELLSPKT